MSFPLGRVVATPGALHALEEARQQPAAFLSRHRSRDWGEVSRDDAKANDLALEQGTRLLSIYQTSKGEQLWVITEGDRSSTCILLPEEY